MESMGRRTGRAMAVMGRTARAAALGLLAAAWFPGAAVAADPVRTEPVVVTATRIEEKVSEQASSVSVVEKEAIELKNPGLAGDVLQDLPGVTVERSGSAGSRENIRVRGGPATGTLVLIDGFPVNSPTLGSFDIGSLPAARFERIEVVRGAQSALYGSNAMSGVVNFIPPSPQEGRRYGAAAALGDYGTFQWNGYAEGGGRRGSYHLGGAGFTTDGFMPNDDASLVSFLGGGQAAVGDRNRVHFLAMSTESDKGVPVDFGTEHDVNHRAKRRGLLAGARWETLVSPSLTLTASGSVFDESWYETDPADPGESFPFVFDDTTKTRKADGGLMARVTAGETSVTFIGLELTRDHGTDTLSTEFPPPTETEGTTINRSVYVQEEWRPRTGTGVSLGFRVDGNTEAGTQFNPRLALFQDLGATGVRLRAAAGRGFRTPTIAEKTDPFIGNPDLASEVTYSYEAGADAVLAGGDATISATWFFLSFRDLIQFDGSVAGPQGFGQLLNSGSALSRGVESKASWRISRRVTGEIIYTYTDTWDSSSARRILAVPTQQGTASLILTPVADLTCQADWHVESDQLDAPPNGGDIRRPGYARIDVYGRYVWRVGSPEGSEVALQGKVENLLNRNYEERKGYPSPGIHFLLGLELTI
jgi:vitamin B12 transporter